MSWVDCELGDVVTLKRGHDLPNGKRKEGNIPVVSSSGITGWHNEAKAEPPGVVTGRYGTIGEVFFLDRPYWPLNTALYAIDYHGNDPRFIAYFLRSHLKNYKSEKAAVPGVDRNVLHKLKVRCPDLHTQERIAGVLSAYDDLIENNRRRIALLEQAARLLYREWFVHFRFPGYETAEFIDGLPKGWEQRRLEDVTTKLGSGATPRGGAGAYKASGISLIRSLNVYDRSFHDADLAFIDDTQAKKLANVIVEKDDVLLNITGASVARCCTVPERHLPARVNQHVMIVRADRELTGPFFLMLSLTSHQYKERLLSIARAGGATREALNKTVVENFQVLHPPFELMSEFESKVSAMISQVEKLAAANDKLAKVRDLLLPRLMDGRLSIPE